MTRELLSVVAFSLTLLATSCQVASKNELPLVRIVLPNDVSYERAWVSYEVVGSQNSRTAFDEKVRSGPYYQIWAAPGDRVKAAVWVPGCKMREFDLQTGSSTTEQTYVCDRTRDVTLRGRVRRVGRGTGSETVSVLYEAVWPCSFLSYCPPGPNFCQFSCGWQGIGIADVKVETNGTFKVDLPDFSADQIAVGGSFSLVLISGGRVLSQTNVTIAAAYPNDLILSP